MTAEFEVLDNQEGNIVCVACLRILRGNDGICMAALKMILLVEL